MYLRVQEVSIEFIKVKPFAGSAMTNVYNVNRNGQPFGQVWTFKNTRTEVHPYHAVLAADPATHQTFSNIKAAKDWMVEQARAV